MFDGQMEMCFGKASYRQRKQSRAQWWFQRMRQIVERARDWQPAPAPRPVQIWFPAAQERLNGNGEMRKPAANVKPAEERQICE